jgi:UDP-3-O-[3-hydroxymyristoyl] glucosamine N-acyltransferase
VIDPRFYAALGPLPVSDIASAAGFDPPARGGERMLSSVASAAMAGAGDLTFLEDADPELKLQAGACFAPEAVAAALGDGVAVIVTRNPRAAFAAAAARLVGLRDVSTGPAIHPSARIGEGAVLGPGVVVGEGASIGAGARIGPNSVIYPGVQIGWRTSIGANVSVRCALIGEGVTILSGAVIGENGFGLAAGPAGAVLTPHFGRVVIQSSVSIGANTTVDRGLFDDTIIGEGAHIDNLCHIAHNAMIGSHAVMAAFAGVSGSAQVGDGVMFGGRVGLADHVKVGKGARIAAGAAVLQDVAAGETVAGYPAKPIRTWMREGAWLARESQKRGKDKSES